MGRPFSSLGPCFLGRGSCFTPSIREIILPFNGSLAGKGEITFLSPCLSADGSLPRTDGLEFQVGDRLPSESSPPVLCLLVLQSSVSFWLIFFFFFKHEFFVFPLREAFEIFVLGWVL